MPLIDKFKEGYAVRFRFRGQSDNAYMSEKILRFARHDFMCNIVLVFVDGTSYKLKELKDVEVISVEYRCKECDEVGSCPAANTGVCYPCPHFRLPW